MSIGSSSVGDGGLDKRMPNRLQHKVVIVTGAAQGIGFGCARMLASEGASVVLADIQKERGEQAAASVRADGDRKSVV